MASPGWLLALALLPLIRWLHRGGRHRQAVPVAQLSLWQGASARSAASGRPGPHDPAWRRRALWAGLLVLALAQPQGLGRERPVTLWVDDSLSLLTLEPAGRRLALAMAQARAQLAASGATEVAVRTLSEPWVQQHGSDDALLQRLMQRAAGPGQPAPGVPPAALLDARRSHWLLTDGAHPRLLDWPAPARRPDHLVLVGSAQGNVGLQRLSAQRRPDDPQRLDLVVTLHNGGQGTATRTLVLAGDAGELWRAEQKLAPGSSAQVALTLPRTGRVRARLQPADALVEDDTLELALDALAPQAVAVDPACPSALRAAVAAHPALALVDAAASGAAVAAQVTCGSTATLASPARPTLDVLATQTTTRQLQPLQWGASVALTPALQSQALPVAAQLAAQPADQVLLAAGGEPVLVQRAGTPLRLATALDFAALQAAPGPDLPLLLNLALERLLQRRLLGAQALVERGATASQVLPQPLPAPGAGAAAVPDAPSGDASRVLLWLAAAVLLWELGALGRQALRLNGDAA
ncbi:hypothetical protein BurJ1DRAFT_1470 [Burkholderiales bacterium JOSHI_001]|nr:hypothetical protein BurJ1DRAFT_1470 [Burkholderiales bacterium JOSHI_001]